MARHTNYFSVPKVLLFSCTLLAFSAALLAQEQFQNDVVTEISTMKQHMAAQQQQIMAQQQQIMAQQQQMTTMQREMKIQKKQLMETKTAQQQHISGQQQQIIALQQQVNSHKQELTEHTGHMAEDKQNIAGQQQQLVIQQQHIMAVQQQMEFQKHLLTEQTRQLAEQKKQMIGQQQQIATQHQHITALQQQMITHKHLLTGQTQHLTEQLTAQQQQIIALQTTTPLDKHMTRRLLFDDIATDVVILKQQLAAVQATQQKQGLLVATNAHLMHDLSPGPNQRIIYDDVSMNHGNAYSPVHGTFTAPYAGTYVFSMAACSLRGHYIDIDLMQNAIAVKTIIAGSNGYDGCTSATTMLDLHTGDTVWVRHHQTIGDLITTHYSRAVSFTGFLLRAS